jgi:hypothetical protein
MNRRATAAVLGALIAGVVLGRLGATGPRTAAADHDAGAKPGAKTPSPLDRTHLYLCAFHVAKKDPAFQLEAQHYCGPVRDGVHQCVITDTTGAGARVLGVEYIVTDAIYRTLPPGEKKYWHPHAYEVTSGHLIAPDLADGPHLELMKGLVTTWGKAWHTWPDPKQSLPLGDPLLMWSINGDGHLRPDILAARDRRLNVTTATVREQRRRLGYPVPQLGPPKSLDEPGRQWTADGPDQPARAD